MRDHASPYAGSWYPGQPAELNRLLEELEERSRRRTGAFLLRDPLAFVVPHAGLAYSGTVAAAAYRCLAGSRPSRVVLLGFSHRLGPPAVAIPDVQAISTPGGTVTVEAHATAELCAALPFRMVPENEVCDHSVEIQIPLLLRAAPEALFVPLYVGELDSAGRSAAAHAIARLAGPGTVLVASSDFTHYGASFGYEPFPVDSYTAQRLRELDGKLIAAAGSLDSELFLDVLRRNRSTLCGVEPIALLLRTLSLLAPGAIYQETLDYQTSGEITGDFHHSVSYAALGYFRHASFKLGQADQACLLESAHQTLWQFLRTGKREPVPPRGGTPALDRKAGVFVSLHEGKELRGCIGQHAGGRPLFEAVPELTLAAAMDDRRFAPLHSVRNEMEIEISILTPLRRLPHPDAFCLGREGIYLSAGMYRSLLLPQVAQGRSWTAQRFLEALAGKAGLTPDGYTRPGAELYAFEAQVFADRRAIAAWPAPR